MTRRHRTPPAAPPLSTGQSHRHQWVDNPVDQVTDPDDPRFDPDASPFVCQECPATASACVVCRRVSQTGRTCEDCVSRARNDLRKVRDLYRQLPDVIAAIAGLHAVRYDRGSGGKPGKGAKSTDTAILGGDAMVLSVDGTTRPPRLGQWETSVDPVLLAAERSDPPSLYAVLAEWVEQWRAERDEDAPEPSSVDAAVDYLLGATEWAAQHSPSWEAYRHALADLLWRLRRLTGESAAPERSGVPCPYCSGTVIQVWRDEIPGKPGSGGLDDVHRCDQCGLTWASEAHFLLAIRDAHESLPQTRPDELVTLEDAKRIYRRRLDPHTLDMWVNRQTVRPVQREDGRPRLNVRGEPLYRLRHFELAAGDDAREAGA